MSLLSLTPVLGLTWEERGTERQKGLRTQPLSLVEEKAGHGLNWYILHGAGWVDVEHTILDF